LKQLETDVTTSDKVRENAAGALWVLENRDPEIKPQPEPPGLYYLTFTVKYSNCCQNATEIIWNDILL